MEGNNKSRAAGEMTLSGNPSKGQRSLRNAFKAFRKRGVLVLASFLIVFLALCGFHYFRSGHTASTVLSLDYEQGEWRINNWLPEDKNISESTLVKMEKYVGR